MFLVRVSSIAAHGPNVSGGRTSKYLLSGLMKCDECGSSFIMADSRSYQCSAHKYGGENACKNGIRVTRKVAEAVLLADIKNEMLSDEAIAHFRNEIVRLVKQVKRELAAKKSNKADKVELAQIDKKLHNLVQYIENEGYDSTVKSRLDELQSRRDELLALDWIAPPELDALPDLVPDALARYRDKIAKLENLPADATPAQITRFKSDLSDLLTPIRLRPDYDRNELEASYGLNEKALALVSKDYSAFAYNIGSWGVICIVPTLPTRIRLR